MDDLTGLLSGRLEEAELAVLCALAQEMTVHEIASAQNLHCQTIKKIQRQLRSKAVRLGYPGW